MRNNVWHALATGTTHTCTLSAPLKSRAGGRKLPRQRAAIQMPYVVAWFACCFATWNMKGASRESFVLEIARETIRTCMQLDSSEVWSREFRNPLGSRTAERISRILAQVKLKREKWWADVAMAAMTCGTRSAGVGFGSATRTTQMVDFGCDSTATYAYAVGSTLPLAGCTILVQPPSLGHPGPEFCICSKQHA